MASGFIFLPEFGSKSWKSPVDTFLDLPTIGNEQGDARVTLDTDTIYIWTGSTWVSSGGGSGVTSLNSLTGALNIVAGAGITVTTLDPNITIAAITPNAVSAIELTFTAATNVAAFQMVVSASGTTASPGNDNTTVQNSRVIGIAKTSATTGNTFVALLFGTITDSSFSGFTLNNPVYLDTTGFLTQTLPVSPNFMVVCGKYLGSNTVFINISLPIQL